ncbi:helix-turn-helix transcriptional regulator [Actinomadura rubrisoli]|uniref:DNA-binding protein n=1 Tax=Actinomadura rubrisoli TaxID=2530368 RepID=A0A4R5B9X1_9ACTN|nr:helix-turn-helix transcriptional regulator [Actinomadura rubrisoli]TDD81450.1 DNA-binding protein [Actinomadura rubrisoli]
MSTNISGLAPDAPFARRLEYYRKRSGKSRAVLAGLVGRSAEWVKGLETGRLGLPRLPMLIRLAEALDVEDLADLVGDQRLSRAAFTKHAHESLGVVRDALASYPVAIGDAPVPADVLAGRVEQAWKLWHTTKHERSAVAGRLPRLLTDARVAARVLDGAERREASCQLAQIYHLAQLYTTFQPAPELVYMTSDRAMLAAQDADDPAAMAGAAWYLNHVWRDAGEAAEARVEVARDVAGMLRPDADPQDLALYSLMHLAIALSHAKVGREGEAWHHHDKAETAARRLPPGYTHPWLMIGKGMVEHYAVTMHLDLQKPALALHAADKIDPAAIPSRTRQSRYLVEVARAHHRRRDDVAAVHLMRKAEETSADTFAFSLFARSMVAEMLPSPPATVADEVRSLARSLHLIA